MYLAGHKDLFTGEIVGYAMGSRMTKNLVTQFGMKASMSRKGNCYDNSPMESFRGILKQELVHHRRYTNRNEAIREIREYIEIFYNRQRRQARLGYFSPAVNEKKYYAEQKLAA